MGYNNWVWQIFKNSSLVLIVSQILTDMNVTYAALRRDADPNLLDTLASFLIAADSDVRDVRAGASDVEDPDRALFHNELFFGVNRFIVFRSWLYWSGLY